MTQEQKVSEPISIASKTGGTTPSKSKTEKSKPTKVLPTERIAFNKQLDLLRAFAAASGPSGKTVRNDDVANIMSMAATTVAMANSFFTDVGFLQRTDSGFIPASEVMAYARAFEWNPESASQKLAPLIEKAWFSTELLPKVSFRQIAETEAISDLAQAAAAGPGYKAQIRVLVDYMVAAGLVVREGENLRKVSGKAATPPESKGSASEPKENTRQGEGSTVATAFSNPTEGVVQFHVSVKVNMAEFAGWQPERITAFFGGIAQVLAAKGALEKGAAE